MADYYIQFSESIEGLTDEEKTWVKEELTPPLERDTSEAFLEDWPRFSWTFDGDELWIFSDDNGCVDHVGIFVQRFLSRWRPEGIFKLTWSDTCSSLRIGAFSGGWLVVSKDEVIYGNAYCEAEKAEQALKTGDFRA